MRVVSFKIQEKLLEELDKFCIKKGMCRSDAIRLAIKMLLQREKALNYGMRFTIRKVRVW